VTIPLFTIISKHEMFFGTQSTKQRRQGPIFLSCAFISAAVNWRSCWFALAAETRTGWNGCLRHKFCTNHRQTHRNHIHIHSKNDSKRTVVAKKEVPKCEIFTSHWKFCPKFGFLATCGNSFPLKMGTPTPKEVVKNITSLAYVLLSPPQRGVTKVFTARRPEKKCTKRARTPEKRERTAHNNKNTYPNFNLRESL